MDRSEQRGIATFLTAILNLGLRARVILAFAIGALFLSLLLSSITYSTTRANLLSQRQTVAFESARNNRSMLDDRLLSSGTKPNELLEALGSLALSDGTKAGVFSKGRYTFSDTVGFTEAKLEPQLRDAIEAGKAVHMRYSEQDETFYAVSLPLVHSGFDGTYIEAYPLKTTESNLAKLRVTLTIASTVTTLLGLGFGFYTSQRLFRPLEEVSQAALKLADGDLDTRLEETVDPDLKDIAGSFNHMSSALQDRIERDSRFASDVSHELRSPLMTLTGSLAVLKSSKEQLSERGTVALNLLDTEIKRFRQLVEDLLEISRFDVGAVALEHEEVLLCDFIERAIKAATSGRDVKIIAEESLQEVIVTIDKRRIAQVIRNLSGNADKYANGVTQIRILRDGEDISIELEDEGPGVPVEERELIFERFARGSEGGRRGKSSGVGLGLSLVAEHLRLHNGTIRVDDRLDAKSGARFIIDLPGVVTE